MGIRKYFLLAALIPTVTACGFADIIGATKAYNYATVIHDDERLGFGIGAQAPFRGSPLSIGIEVGGYQDDTDETVAYAFTHVETDLIENRERAPRIGAFVGFVNDAEIAARFEDRYPVIGNFAPVVGFQATVPTYGPHELRLRVAPGLSSDTAIFSLQSTFVF